MVYIGKGVFLALSQLVLALFNRGLHRKRVFLALSQLVLALFNRGLHRKRGVSSSSLACSSSV